MLANDFQYADPDNLVVFPDNHDMSRLYTQVKEDYDLFKLGMSFILTHEAMGNMPTMDNRGHTDTGQWRTCQHRAI